MHTIEHKKYRDTKRKGRYIMAKWQMKEQSEERTQGIEQLMKDQQGLYGFSKPVVEVLYNRGVRTVKDIDELTQVAPEVERDFGELKDIDKASQIIIKHINAGNKIIVMGDYDTDGVAATSIMVRALRNIGGDVDYFVNDRFKHGFGINKLAVIDLLAEKGTPDLIVTVDNGIVGYEGVQHAVDNGVEVVITDHHLADDELPNASAVVNPQRKDDTSTFKEICGAAVSYKVMLAVYEDFGEEPDYIYDMRDLVAMATVGDMMPLIDENRWYVNAGLELIGKATRPQFEVLRFVKQGDKAWTTNPDLFGFTIGPMMNAPGRLIGVPDIAIDFFLTDDEQVMHDLARELDLINEQRKQIARDQVALSERIVDVDASDVIVVYNEDFGAGIIGLIAGQLTEKHGKPSIAFAKGPNGTIKGSARSIEGYPIKDALDRISEHIVQHGGHDGAAGLTIEEAKLADFTQALEEDFQSVPKDTIEKVIEVDAVLHPSEISVGLVEELNRLEPFGMGFEKPLFGMSTLPVEKITFMTGGLHAKITGGGGLNLLMFGGGDFVRELGEVDIVQAVGTPSINEWRGKKSAQFLVHGNCLVGKKAVMA